MFNHRRAIRKLSLYFEKVGTGFGMNGISEGIIRDLSAALHP